jgi:hypothetical protein
MLTFNNPIHYSLSGFESAITKMEQGLLKTVESSLLLDLEGDDVTRNLASKSIQRCKIMQIVTAAPNPVIAPRSSAVQDLLRHQKNTMPLLGMSNDLKIWATHPTIIREVLKLNENKLKEWKDAFKL